MPTCLRRGHHALEYQAHHILTCSFSIDAHPSISSLQAANIFCFLSFIIGLTQEIRNYIIHVILDLQYFHTVSFFMGGCWLR